MNIKKILGLLFILSSLHPFMSFAQENNNTAFKFHSKDSSGIKYGLINSFGKEVIKPIYQLIGDFSEGFAYVELRENNETKIGYINELGEVTITPQFQESYDISRDFSEGLAAVRKNGKYGYVDKAGIFIIEPTFHKAFPFNNNLAIIEVRHGVKYLIDRTGTILFDPVERYNDYKKLDIKGEWLTLSERINEGVILVAINRYDSPTKMSIMNSNGAILFPFKNLMIHEFHNGIAKALTTDYQSTGYINKAGEVVIPFNFSRCSDFHNGLAMVKDKTTKLYGIINTKGDYVIEPEFSFLSDDYYKDSLILAKKPNGWFGYIDYEGNTMVDFIYKYGQLFSEDLAIVRTLKNEYVYINRKGKKEFNLNFDIGLNEGNFKGGLAKVNLEDGYAYINKIGEVVYRFK